MEQYLSHTDACSFINEYPESRLTDWFDCVMRPEHVGWYQVQYAELPNGARFWDGCRWMLYSGSKDDAHISKFQNWSWRGLLIGVNPFHDAMTGYAVFHDLMEKVGVKTITDPARPRIPRKKIMF